MSFFLLCFLCVIQGITEFLPISSSGHLLLVEKLFGVNADILGLNLFLHLATLFAVVVVYRKTILNLIKKPFQPLTYKLLISTVFTVIIAVIYKVFDLDDIANKFYGLSFLLTAAILFFTHQFQKKSAILQNPIISYKSAIAVGIAQGFAVVPGLSRSGTTISTLLLFGNNESNSAQYSFLLSIPIIVGGFVLELLSADFSTSAFAALSFAECGFAFVFTFFVSLISLKLTIKMLKGNKFIYSSIYLVLIGIFSILFSIFG